jgi:hypothetical protein
VDLNRSFMYVGIFFSLPLLYFRWPQTSCFFRC